jgi:hypothetical protein
LDVPLDELADDIQTFTVNRIAPIFNKVSWRPDFYLCGTMRIGWNKDYAKDFYTALESSGFNILGKRIAHLVDYDRIEKVNYCWADFLDVQDKETSGFKYEYWYRNTEREEISIYGHTCFGSIQLARFMEFDEIILGGMDLPYKAPKSKNHDPNHYYSKYETKGLMPKDWQYKIYNTNLKFAHEWTALMSKKDGLKIYSLETNQGLDYYERIKVDELI